jgi:hypothetical protein
VTTVPYAVTDIASFTEREVHHEKE